MSALHLVFWFDTDPSLAPSFLDQAKKKIKRIAIFLNKPTWIKVTHVTSCWGQETKKSPPTKLYANMQLPSMSFANIISEQTFFFFFF